jgi:hypothetical protein
MGAPIVSADDKSAPSQPRSRRDEPDVILDGTTAGTTAKT